MSRASESARGTSLRSLGYYWLIGIPELLTLSLTLRIAQSCAVSAGRLATIRSFLKTGSKALTRQQPSRSAYDQDKPFPGVILVHKCVETGLLASSYSAFSIVGRHRDDRHVVSKLTDCDKRCVSVDHRHIKIC